MAVPTRHVSDKGAVLRFRAHTAAGGFKSAACAALAATAGCSIWLSGPRLSGVADRTGRTDLAAHRCSNFLSRSRGIVLITFRGSQSCPGAVASTLAAS